MQGVHMSGSPGSTECGQETGKEVEHILLVKMFLSGEGVPNPPINSTLVILHVTFGFAFVSCQRKGEGHEDEDIQ